MAWKSNHNKRRVLDVYVIVNGQKMPAIDMYSVKDGAPRRWVKSGGYIPEHYYIQKEDETFLFLSENGLPIITE